MFVRDDKSVATKKNYSERSSVNYIMFQNAVVCLVFIKISYLNGYKI